MKAPGCWKWQKHYRVRLVPWDGEAVVTEVPKAVPVLIGLRNKGTGQAADGDERWGAVEAG